MASIENRSRTQVKVKNRDDLTRLFPFNKPQAAESYVSELALSGLKPLVAILDEAYLVRYMVNGRRKSYTAKSMADAVAIQQRIESDQHHSLFVDYSKAHQCTFAELLVRYLKEEAPRNKGFLVSAYQINMWLEDAGLERQDIAAIHAAHPKPQNPDLHIPKPSGRRMSPCCDAAAFIRKPFAKLMPDDFQEYTDERLQSAQPATVDRELDVFRAVCNTAISKWRVHVHANPLTGFEGPKYFNERDRRLRGDEEARLMEAAYGEDCLWSVRALADELYDSQGSDTKYQRLKAYKEARQAVQDGGQYVPMFGTFIQFQLMSGARRSETLKLNWRDVNLEERSAFLRETKNGRARTLPLREDLIELLQRLPRTSEYVFPIPSDYLRKAWTRICEAAGVETVGCDRLRIHDLRHEAISRVAEAGSRTPGGFSLLDLQAFSGHRDPRMLLRYTHLTPAGLAKRLDAAFSEDGVKGGQIVNHQGRTRLTKQAGLTMSELMVAPLVSQVKSAEGMLEVDQQGREKSPERHARSGNVIELLRERERRT